MKYHNPFLFLVGIIIALFFLACVARADDRFDEDARAAIAVALALEEVKVNAANPCDIAGCKCGCAEGGVCTCSSPKNKAGDRKNGYTYADDGYWYKDVPAEPVTYDHYFPPEAYSQWAARQIQQQPQFFARPMSGGMRGCSGGG